ncbi:hypothetical protein VTG60DRAFT_4448 [Thermothelomyces hinnuleus]
MGYYYQPEPEPRYYTRPPPRAHYAPGGSRGVIVQVEGPRPVSPSPTRVVVVEKRRRREPQGFLSWFCAAICCFWVCSDCAEGCSSYCCPAVAYDSD